MQGATAEELAGAFIEKGSMASMNLKMWARLTNTVNDGHYYYSRIDELGHKIFYYRVGEFAPFAFVDLRK